MKSKSIWKTAGLIGAATFLFLGMVVAIGIYSPRDRMVQAACYGDLRTLTLLTNLGADPSIVGWEEHFTHLGMAAQAGQKEAVKFLLHRGADVNRRDDSKRTALWWARRQGHKEIERMLLASGAKE